MKRSRLRAKGRKFNVRKKLDDILRVQIRERDGNRCQKCGRTNGLGISHVFPKGRYAALRWEPANLMLLCWFCHGHWWHLHPVESGEWFRKNWPERYEQLWALANQGQKVNPKQLYEQLTGEQQ